MSLCFMQSIVNPANDEIHAESEGSRRVMNLFAYGTLMWPEVLEAVIGRPLSGTPAVLRGFVRIRVKGELYPALLDSHCNDVVEGMLYRDLTEKEFRSLDRFEGGEYDRKEVCVGAEQAHTYVLSHTWRHIADPRPWRPEDMREEYITAFCS
jgi:gamma-glutamylcyclotransferase (GGCT)/AIG2-like uncharacterized protein YtfP